MKEEKVKKLVRKRYGGIAGGESGCGCNPESSCCGGEASTTDGLEAFQAFGYDTDEVKEFFGSDGAVGLSCGNPIGIAGISEGETVLDLGSGMGFDCYLASLVVGESGSVIGVDMTPEMIEKARAKLAEEGSPRNIEFRLGEIERLPVEDDSVDVIISNCVINLSPDKWSVFREAFRVLKSGGRLAVSDVIAIRPLPVEITDDPEMHCSCIAGAVTAGEFRGLMKDAGFEDIRIRPKGDSKRIVDGWAPGRHVGDYIVSAEIWARKP
jgi:arsenite methyltransferase